MRIPLLKKLIEFAQNGLKIVGQLPSKSPSLEGYPNADFEIQELSKELSKYNILSNDTNLKELFAEMDLTADFSYTSDANLLYIHRQTKDADIYFISNQKEEQANFEATFRSCDGAAELWYPASGEQMQAIKTATNNLSLRLAPLESLFVVFRKDKQNSDLPNRANLNEQILLTLNQPWGVDFTDRVNGEQYTTSMTNLEDWTLSNDDKVKYFSGEATYTTTFELSQIPESATYLDFERVAAMAKVSLNGKEVGGIWTPPYRVNITGHLQEGENKLEVTVVNCWRNRLIYEMGLSKDKQILSSSIMPNLRNGDLASSGLIGSAKLLIHKSK